MEYKNLVRDFALRTRRNLDFLRAEKAARPNAEIFEVTQLINSLLGLLVLPQQRYFDRIPKTPLDELPQQGWPVPKIVGDYPQVQDLNQLIRYLRNGVAHFNLKFVSDRNGEINGIRVWNMKPVGSGPNRREEKSWEVELSLTDIEKISDKFIAMVLEEPTLEPQEQNRQ